MANKGLNPRELAETALSPDDRLLEAAFLMWQSHGRAGLSARKVAAEAGVTTSLINYHFGNFEHLLLVSFERGLNEIDAWAWTRTAQLPRFETPSAEATGHILFALIDGLVGDRRAAVFAWFECQVLASRDGAFLPVALRWRRIWETLWSAVAEACGLPGTANLLRQFADSELSYHRIAWNAVLDRAILNETCVAFARLLVEGRGGAMPLRDQARERALSEVGDAPEAGSLGDNLAAAAARVLGSDGAAAITHRRVAHEAKVNLGSVTYHFPTADLLIHATFEHVYREMVRAPQGHDATTRPDLPTQAGPFAEGIGRYFCDPANAPALSAVEELISATARDAQLVKFGGALRYTRGRSMMTSLERMAGTGRPFGRGDAALFSGWIHGVAHDVRLDPPETRAQSIADGARQLLGLVGIG